MSKKENRKLLGRKERCKEENRTQVREPSLSRDEVLQDKFGGLRFCPRGPSHRFLTLAIILSRPTENEGIFGFSCSSRCYPPLRGQASESVLEICSSDGKKWAVRRNKHGRLLSRKDHSRFLFCREVLS